MSDNPDEFITAGGSVVAVARNDKRRDINRWKSVDVIRSSVPGSQNPLLRQGSSPADWAGKDPPPRRWIVDGLIPVGAVTLLSGDGALGKSLLALQLQAACAIGANWIGQATMQCGSVGFYSEDDEGEIHRRGQTIYQHYGVDLTDDRLKQVRHFERVGLDNSLVEFGRAFDREDGVQKNKWDVTRFYLDVVEVARRRGARLVILDALHDYFLGQENDRAMVRYFMSQLRNIATEIDGAVLLLAHPSVAGMASGTGSSGSTAWNNAARSRLYLTRPDEAGGDPDLRILSTMKSNYGRIGKRIEVKWAEGIFIAAEQAGMVGELVRNNQVNAVLEGLRILAAQCRSTSENSRAGNYAPKLLASLPVCRGIGKTALQRIVSDLLATGTIAMRQIGKGGDRHPLYGLVEVKPGGPNDDA